VPARHRSHVNWRRNDQQQERGTGTGGIARRGWPSVPFRGSVWALMTARSGPLPPGVVRLWTAPSWCYWLAAFAALIPVWIGGRFPTEDGPAHVYYTAMYRALGRPGNAYEPFFERSAHWNTPNLLYFGLQDALSAVLEPHLAQRLAVSLILLATTAATYMLARKLVGGPGLGAFTALLLLHNSFLYAGYFSFLAGVPFLLLTAALLADPTEATVGGSGTRARWLFLVTLCGLLAFYAHLAVAGMFGVLVGLRVLYWPGASVSRRAWLALTTVPVLVLVITYMLGPSTGHGGPGWMQAGKALRSFEQIWFWQGFARPDLGYRVRRWSFTIVLLVLTYRALRMLIARAAPRPTGYMLLAAGTFIVLRFGLPDRLGTGGVLGQRMDLAAWSLLLPALSLPRSRRTHLALTAVVLVTLSWQLADVGRRIGRFNRAYAAVDAAAQHIRRGSIIRGLPSNTSVSFEGSFASVLGELTQDVALRCGCIVIGGHHPSTTYYWVRQRPGVEDTPADLLVRVEPAGTDETKDALVLRMAKPGTRKP
jgi:hypothetical protein